MVLGDNNVDCHQHTNNQKKIAGVSKLINHRVRKCPFENFHQPFSFKMFVLNDNNIHNASDKYTTRTNFFVNYSPVVVAYFIVASTSCCMSVKRPSCVEPRT